MTFEEVLDQAIAMLQRRGRLTYRTLQLQFQLDEAHLEALKDELIYGQRLAMAVRACYAALAIQAAVKQYAAEQRALALATTSNAFDVQVIAQICLGMMLGTMAPLTEEILSFPFGGIAPGDDAYGLAFAIPTDAPGLKFICRETVSPPLANRFDHPLSSRFEEMDCVVIFDDVLVPWDRVMVDGGPGSAAVLNQVGGNMAAMVNVQTSARMLSQMEFFCGLAMKLADAIGITGFLHVQEKLGEMLSTLEVARGVFYGTEALARQGPDGIWTITSPAGRGFHLQTMRIYRRFVEIVHLLGGGGFFYAASQADLENPEERPYIDKYLRGRPGISAEERVRLFKLAWDVTGSAFAQRVTQYVTFYSGDPVRLTAGFYLGYDKEPLFEIVDRALGVRHDLDIPVSPTDPGAPVPRRPPLPGALTHAYPAASQPQPRRTNQ